MGAIANLVGFSVNLAHMAIEAVKGSGNASPLYEPDRRDDNYGLSTNQESATPPPHVAPVLDGEQTRERDPLDRRIPPPKFTREQEREMLAAHMNRVVNAPELDRLRERDRGRGNTVSGVGFTR